MDSAGPLAWPDEGQRAGVRTLSPVGTLLLLLVVPVSGEDSWVNEQQMDSCPGSLTHPEPQCARPSGCKEETTIPVLETHTHRGGITQYWGKSHEKRK